MKATTHHLASVLRHVADWLEAQIIDGESLVAVNVDAWGDCYVHLTPAAFADLVPTCEFIDGHGVGFVGGMKVVTVLPKRQEREPEAMEART